MSDFHSPRFEDRSQEPSTPQPGGSPETQLWNSLDIGSPQELGVGDARQRFPQLVSAAQRGQAYVVRNLNRPESEAVVIVSLNQLHRIAASMSEPVSGKDILARLPFADTSGLEALAPAPLPNPGIPMHLGAILNPDAGSSAREAC